MVPSAVEITHYTFNPHARTVTFTDLTSVDPTRVGIYDTSVPTEGQPFGTVLYLPQMAGQAEVDGNVLTLPNGSIPVNARATDILKISYEVTPPHGFQLLRYANLAGFPNTGVSSTWYLAEDTGQTYVWDGVGFVAV